MLFPEGVLETLGEGVRKRVSYLNLAGELKLFSEDVLETLGERVGCLLAKHFQ